MAETMVATHAQAETVVLELTLILVLAEPPKDRTVPLI